MVHGVLILGLSVKTQPFPLEEIMSFYEMRRPDDCGPAAIAAVTRMAYSDVIKDWPGGWLSTDKGKLGIPNDTPWDHAVFLESKNLRFRYVSFEDIATDKCVGNRTIILLHLLDIGEKKTFFQKIKQFFYPTFNKHWVVLHSVSTERNTISLHWGNGEIKTHTLEHFKKLFKGAWPICAYIVGDGDTKMSWFTRTFAKLTGRFI